MASIIEKEMQDVQEMLDGKIDCLDVIYNCCIDLFKKDYKENSWIISECYKYINNYFIKLKKRINDLSIRNIMPFNDEETKCIRYLCKVDSNQNIISPGYARTVFNRFKQIVSRDVNYKVKYLLKELSNGNSRVLDSEIIGLFDMDVNSGAYKKAKYYLLYDYLKLTKRELKSYLSDENYSAVVKCAHLHGFRFADEIDDSNERDLSSYRLNELFDEFEKLEVESRSISERYRFIYRRMSAIVEEISKLSGDVDSERLRRRLHIT